MPNRDERRVEAAKHISLMKGVFAKEIEDCIAGARTYEDGEGRELPIPDPNFETTRVEVTTDFPVTALYKCKGKAVVIDPASFTRPGGNYEEGGFGPEQAICSESVLYPVLQGLTKQYYDKNRGYVSGQLFTDHALYLTDVTFARNGSMRTADVLAIAAPNRARALENHRSPEGCDLALRYRIEALLRIAAANGRDTLICGAFGCGGMGNDPERVAGLFKAWIDAHPGIFETVVFAVPRTSLEAFERAFGVKKEPEPQRAEPVEESREDDPDDLDLSSIELPEGITVR